MKTAFVLLACYTVAYSQFPNNPFPDNIPDNVFPDPPSFPDSPSFPDLPSLPPFPDLPPGSAPALCVQQGVNNNLNLQECNERMFSQVSLQKCCL